MNTSRTGEVDWEEVVSHLILGYFGNDSENQRESLQPPIMGLPVIIRSQHRHPISRITFSPDVDKVLIFKVKHVVTNLKPEHRYHVIGAGASEPWRWGVVIADLALGRRW